jgi:spore germination cell wall hydrolase CwlJ-like protein
MLATMCLALTIYHEARNQNLDGQIAVAQVVINRVHDPHYPSSVCEVVHQGPVTWTGSPVIGECQFDWWCDGKSDVPKDRRSMRKAMVIAEMVIAGKLPDKTNGATHFHSIKVNPDWDFQFIARVGDHLLYR